MDRFRTVTGVATTACLALTTQIALGQGASSVGNLGLRTPGAQTTIERRAIGPDLAPMGSTMLQMPTQMPLLGQSPGYVEPAPAANDVTTMPVRALADPVVAANSVGFYNGAGLTLSFQFVAGGDSQRIELAPRQILTIPVDAGGNDLRAIVGTGNTDFQTTLSLGRIYVLRADGGRWVIAAY
jgi:hypothetical protein